MKESFLTGRINGIPYRRLLTAELFDSRIDVSISLTGIVIISLPIDKLREVKLARNIVMFGIKIRYYGERNIIKTIKLYTANFEQWAQAFQDLKVTVVPHGGWFEIDWLE